MKHPLQNNAGQKSGNCRKYCAAQKQEKGAGFEFHQKNGKKYGTKAVGRTKRAIEKSHVNKFFLPECGGCGAYDPPEK